MRVPTKNVGLMCSVVLTFNDYRQTDKQTDKQNIYDLFNFFKNIYVLSLLDDEIKKIKIKIRPVTAQNRLVNFIDFPFIDS